MPKPHLFSYFVLKIKVNQGTVKALQMKEIYTNKKVLFWHFKISSTAPRFVIYNYAERPFAFSF